MRLQSIPRLLNVFVFVVATTMGTLSYARDFQIPGPIQARMEYFRTSNEPDLQERYQAQLALIQALKNIQYPTLNEALAKSDLNKHMLELLNKNSQGVISLNELPSKEALSTGYSLGISGQGGIYEMLSERYSMIAWTEGYPDFKIDWKKIKNHTDLYLTRVQETGKPVVFFVPNQTLSYSGKSVTVDEFRWFLADVSRMKNVYFVFGVYDIIDENLLTIKSNAGFSNDEFRALFMRAIGAESSLYDNSL